MCLSVCNITITTQTRYRRLVTTPPLQTISVHLPSPPIATKTMKSQKEAEAKVRSWGFSNVFTWTDGANARMS